ncbi:MAG: nucleoside hydrolase [Chloroflexota bacterium]
MEKVILDMDPGLDDALALMLALRSPEIDLLAVTTVAGNAALDVTTANTCRVLKCMGREDVPVFCGAARPLQQNLAGAIDYHGADGLANCGLAASSMIPQDVAAWDAMAQHARSGDLTVVATGPLTNVAIAFATYPELPDLLRRLVIMGGAYGLTKFGRRGNQTESAEFNVWQDPEAAASVFGAQCTTYAVGLDVSTDPCACITPGHVGQLEGGKTPYARLAAKLAGYAVARHGRCELHDPLALGVVLDEGLFEFAAHRVEVTVGNGPERGRTLALEADGSDGNIPVHIAVSVDGQRFLRLLTSRLLEE